VTRFQARRFSDPYKFDRISEELSRFKAPVERVDFTFGNLSLAPGPLNHLIVSSPGICYNFSSLRMLSISMDTPVWSRHPEDLSFKHIQLPNLHTLRLLRDHIREQIRFRSIEFPPVVLPVLRRLIVSDVHPSQYRALLEANAEKVRIFEFDASPVERGWHFRYANPAYPISLCPNLEELYFPILVAKNGVDLVVDTPGDERSPRIRHVGLHATAFELLKHWNGYVGGFILYHKDNKDGDPTCYEEWELRKLEEQFAFIETFEFLENITLYGSDWEVYFRDNRFLRIIERLLGIGITVRADVKAVKDLWDASFSSLRSD